MSPHPLGLHHQMMLLSLGDDGIPALGGYELAGSGACILAELAIARAIELTGDESKVLVTGVRDGIEHDPALRRALDLIVARDEPTLAGYWVNRLVAERAVRTDLMNALEVAGMIRRETRRVLILFRRDAYPLIDASVRDDLHDRLSRCLFDGEHPDRRTAILLSIGHPIGLLWFRFPSRELELAARVKELRKDEVLGDTLSRPLEASTSSWIMRHGSTLMSP